MGAKVIIFDKILNSTFLKGLRHSAMYQQFSNTVVKGIAFSNQVYIHQTNQTQSFTISMFQPQLIIQIPMHFEEVRV